MIYKSFKNLELSALGMGTMRLPLDGNRKIDEAATKEMIAYAIEKGVNYFDTAWGYHGGESERVVGKLLSEYKREKYLLASKFPGYDISNMGKAKEIFAEQLKKCRVDYFDFYLFHNVCELNIEAYLDDEKFHTHSVLKALKESGKIKHLGFSAHGTPETMKRFLEAYGSDMEFCQLQLNYLDYGFQDGIEKLALLKEYGIPVWVMEPLRGGRLASLRDKYAEKLKALRPEESIPAWAFRFLQTLPDIRVTLSGMSDLNQLMENIKTFECEKPLNETEMKTLLEIADEMTSSAGVPCTGCRYCVEHCPQQLDIPRLLKLYNEHCFTGGGFIAPMSVGVMSEDKRPSACLGCRSCEAVCPQVIKISEVMAKFASKLKL